jgi:NAD(P)-dependent dehydrogenase (short-subunit alcohol dehydrogenase family)
MSRLKGKSGIVTGAAGGIGSAACRAFAAEGAFVGLIDRPGPALDALALELGDAAVALPADVTSEAEVAAAYAVWDRQRPHADFVYVCAGQQLHDVDGRIGEISLQTWERTLSVNLTGAFLCVKYAMTALCAASAGSLILCGSPTGLTMSGAGNTAYGASKAGMMALARIVAADYANQNVRANVIVPGTTRTPLIEPLLADEDVHAALLAGAPIGRLGTPEDLTGVAVFLASDESRYATGVNFAIDGGLTVR